MEKTPWPFQFVTKISKSRCKQFIFYLCFILWNLFLEILGRAHRHPDFLDFLSWIWCQCESDEVHSLSHPEQVFGPPPTSPAENPVCLFFIDISSVDHHFCWSKDKSKDRGLWDILYITYGWDILVWRIQDIILQPVRYIHIHNFLFEERKIQHRIFKQHVHAV